MIGQSNAGTAPTAALVLFVAVLAAQRIGELILSARNAKRLKALGAEERSPGHFPLLVLVHVLLLAALAAEVLVLGARPGRFWPAWGAVWLGAQGLRYAAIQALGERWNVRIWVVPGLPPVRTGPYRLLRHPNYLAVVIELVAGPMIFGAWRTAAGISALNLVALAIRIRAEERAWRDTRPGAAAGGVPGCPRGRG